MSAPPTGPTSRAFAPADEQLALLRRGAVHLVDEVQLRAKLERSRATGKPLSIKTGFDPSSPDLHLGHTVLLRKMRHFQDLGHRVVFLVGSFTALIGDPTGKKSTRPQLTQEQVLENAKTYQEQVWKVLDRERTEVVFNGDWLEPLGSAGIVRLAGRYTLARILEREDFKTRFAQQQPIHLHELLYPLVQGYDSVVLKADVELGGQDQIFNLLVGRDLMKEDGLEPQVVLTTPLLVGLDGVEKMSKSLGNAIAVDDPPREMYGRTMSIPDSLMWDWFLLLTDLAPEVITARRQEVVSGTLHPMQCKHELAHSIVASFHDAAAAVQAGDEFRRVFSSRGVPEEIEEVSRTQVPGLAKLLVDLALAPSNGEARRLIEQGAVSVDGERAGDPTRELSGRSEPYLLKVGKRRFLRLRVGERSEG